MYVRWGGERVYHQMRQGNTEILTILDEPATRNARHSDENMTVGETIEAEFDMMRYIEPERDYTEEVHELIAKYLSPRQREAFEYFYYTDMTAQDVAEEMRITRDGAQSLKTSAKYKLRKYREEIREELYEIGLTEQGREMVV